MPFPASGTNRQQVPGVPLAAEVSTFVGDTIRMPGPVEQPVVRPALAMLYRLAVGPNADHYAPRFRAFDRSHRGRPGWHWPAFLVPPAWAAYRGLWLPAFVFALLPLVGAMIFLGLGPAIDRSDVLWGAWALLLVWVVPGLIAASCAHFLVYRRVRRQALDAEQETNGAVEAAVAAAAGPATSRWGAAAGALGMLLALSAVTSDLTDAYRDHAVRRQVSATLAAVAPVERRVEETWATARLVPRQTVAVPPGRIAPAAVADVHVSPSNGRLRVRFGAALPELAGKAILLAPTSDAQSRTRWLCIPVDIPTAYLPVECRRG